MPRYALNLYTDYLITSFSYTTATGLSGLVDNAISHDQVMMCQHFYGHKIKLLLATFRNQQVTCNPSLNDVVYGYKKPRYIQRFLALLISGVFIAYYFNGNIIRVRNIS
jgi:uncharacterized protein YdaL